MINRKAAAITLGIVTIPVLFVVLLGIYGDIVFMIAVTLVGSLIALIFASLIIRDTYRYFAKKYPQ